MKKLIFLFLFLPLGLMAQNKFKNQFDQADKAFASNWKPQPNGYSLKDIQIGGTGSGIIDEVTFASSKKIEHAIVASPPFASASITITITDSGSATLADIRDSLCTQWGYSGAANDNTAKLAFLKQFLINKIVNDYVSYKQLQAAQAAQSIQTQVSVN